ncbi:DDE-type integrase/transposase/recombinase [Streptomyces asiaticus]|uniref:DDE-type integrase/transposase/recombinase n=1 Tax=Streptomyces asiaticus TaxID=114695 RepID=UPI003F673046
MGQPGLVPVPGRSTAHRILTRHGLINHQEQNHRRIYRRGQRDAPMQLRQLDIMGGVFLAGGRECKLVTGIDDHSRLIVIAKVVAEPSGRAVCTAFAEAMTTYGVPSEVLADNGKQFTGRFSKPVPAEVPARRRVPPRDQGPAAGQARSPPTQAAGRDSVCNGRVAAVPAVARRRIPHQGRGVRGTHLADRQAVFALRPAAEVSPPPYPGLMRDVATYGEAGADEAAGDDGGPVLDLA